MPRQMTLKVILHLYMYVCGMYVYIYRYLFTVVQSKKAQSRNCFRKQMVKISIQIEIGENSLNTEYLIRGSDQQ